VETSFDTSLGLRITEGLKGLAKRFDLGFKFGTAPQDYTLSRDPYPSKGSLLSLMVDQVLPTALAINNSRANIPNIIITNSGALRFDIYAGPFTKNDQLTALPFNNAVQYIAAVPLGIAKAVLPNLNGAGASSKRDDFSPADVDDAGLYGRGEVEEVYGRWVAEMHALAGSERRTAKNLTLGYVTQDVSCRFLPSSWLPGHTYGSLACL
jgi:hypothetical protein